MMLFKGPKELLDKIEFAGTYAGFLEIPEDMVGVFHAEESEILDMLIEAGASI